MSPSRTSTPFDDRAAASLHRRFLIGVATAGVLAIAALGVTADRLFLCSIASEANSRVAEAALRATLVLNDAITGRGRDADVLALRPDVVAAASEGGARAEALGLVGASVASLERRFSTDRSLMVAPRTRTDIIEVLPHLDARDVLLTERHGFNALVTDRSADFVQGDESWWQEAWRDGHSISDAAYDSASRSSVVALSSVIRDGATKVGVLKVKFDVTPLVASLASAGAGIRIDVLDSAGRVLVSSDSSEMGQLLPGVPSGGSGAVLAIQPGGANERASIRMANGKRWRVIAHVSEDVIGAPTRSATQALVVAVVALLVALLVLLLAMHRFLTRRITLPLLNLAATAEAVAAGDFSVQVQHVASDDEIGRVSRAVGAMVLELRHLAQAIAASTAATNAMSAEITAGSEEMAATAGEIANTASDLAAQATTMAESIGALATSAGSLRGLAGELEAGAHEGVTRNAALDALATENRAGLDASALTLDTLVEDVDASAQAVEALAGASAEIRTFVALVRKLARQSKLLALNAAMEAARAGDEGEGFAVVASEVRRLAAMSSDAAERTESVVKGVLQGIEESRASAERAVSMAGEVRASTARASASFTDIERAVAEADAWTAQVQQTSTAANALVAEMSERLLELSGGTETFAAAMEQVAASSEEQSAATQEIAGAANTLVSAADRLNLLVSGLRLGEEHASLSPASENKPTQADGTPRSYGVPIPGTVAG